MEFLPIEIQFEIFNWLDAKTLLNLRKINSALKSAVECYDECCNAWKKFCQKDIPNQRHVKNLLSTLDNHSNGLISCFLATWDSVYELWMNLNNLEFLKYHTSCNSKIVKRIYQIVCHENFIFCVHSKEILIFDKNGDLIHIHYMKNNHHIATRCSKMLLISFKSEEELNSIRNLISFNEMDLEVINFIKCCTLVFCFVLYKNTGGIDDVGKKIAYLSYKSPKIRKLIEIHGLETIFNDFSNIFNVEVTANESLLIIYKTARISLIDSLDNILIKPINNYLHISIDGSEFLKVTNGTKWFYVKSNLFKISSVLLYVNFLILGTGDGYLYIYDAEQLSKLKLENYLWRKNLTHDSIEHLCVSLIDFYFVVVAATSYRIYKIYFKLK